VAVAGRGESIDEEGRVALGKIGGSGRVDDGSRVDSPDLLQAVVDKSRAIIRMPIQDLFFILPIITMKGLHYQSLSVILRLRSGVV
jgi:hypothetical protein